MGNRILLADDSITIQKVVNLTFADEGIEVVSVSNGDLAERRLGEVNPDLVLADIFMPGKNGYELCESIKQSPQFGNIPVVLLVGAFEPFDQAEARRVRADAHLTKPFESRTLVETVRKLISTSGQARTGSLSPAASVPQPGERQAEEKAQGHTVQPSPMPGFYAATPSHASNESLSLAQDQYAGEDLQPLEIQLTPAAHQEQHDLSSMLPWMEQTESLADVSADHTQHSDLFDLTPLEVAADDTLGVPSAAAQTTGADGLTLGDEHVGLDLETPEPVFPTGFAINDDEMILELERPEDVYMPKAESDSAVDVASDRSFNFTSGGPQGGTIRASSWADTDVFKTQMLEPPAHLSHAGERVNTNPLEMPPASDFNRQGASSAGFADLQQETSSSTLLAVDDPLGDVLLGEQEADVAPYDSHVSEQVLFGEQPVSEEFDIEFNPQEQQIFDIPEPTVTAAKTPVELAEADNRPSEESPLAIGIADLTAEPHAPREATPPEAQPRQLGGAFETSGAQGGSTQNDLSAEWPKSGLGFGSEFQTTAERHADQVEYAFNEPGEDLFEDRQQESGAEFTTSSMWAEQEARFAPIDIEAAAVDEFEPARGPVRHEAVETGFEIAPATEEARATAVEDSRPIQAEAAAQTADLSPAVIDEIVRRVVSQMSESVVREIAWEVVPDVVERVIKEMARNEVSKRN